MKLKKVMIIFTFIILFSILYSQTIFANDLNPTPEKFDLREHISIKISNQGNSNTCWAASANGALQTYLSYVKNEEYNFSTKHIDYATSTTFLDGINPFGYNGEEINSGGHAEKIKYYWLNGLGPILEEDMPYDDKNERINLSELPSNLAVKQVINAKHIEPVTKEWKDSKLTYYNHSGSKMSDNEITQYRNNIKNIIMQYGGICSGIVFDYNYFNDFTGAYNTISNTGEWHGITIIGWDDNYSKDNFLETCKPSTDGAYIAANSYGTNSGDNGYIYISYEDLFIDMSGKTYIIEASDIDYDNVYRDFEKVKSSNEILSKIKINISSVLCGIGKVNIKINGNTLFRGYDVYPGINTFELPEGIKLDSNSTIEFEYRNGLENFLDAVSVYYYTVEETSKLELNNVKGQTVVAGKNEIMQIITNSNVKDNGKTLNVVIKKDNTDVTNNFKITNPIIKSGISRIKIIPKENTEIGEYTVEITNDNLQKISTTLNIITYDVQTYKYIKFNDINLYKKIKDGLIIYDEEFIYWSNDDTLSIIASIEKINDIVTLVVSGNITDLTGLEAFLNLKNLLLGIDNADLSPVMNMTNLENLHVLGGSLANPSAVENLTKLKTIIFRSCKIKNPELLFTALGNIQGIEDVRVNNCKLQNINGIEKLKNLNNLKQLELEENDIKDISLISQLSNLSLDMLKLKHNKISDITPLGTLTNLKGLEIEGNNIADISILDSLENLTELIIYNQTVNINEGNIGLNDTIDVDLPEIIKTIIIQKEINGESDFLTAFTLKNCTWNQDKTGVILNTETLGEKKAKIIYNSSSDDDVYKQTSCNIYYNIVEKSIEDSYIITDEGYLIGIPMNTSLESFNRINKSNKTVKVYNLSEKIISNDELLGTGMLLKIGDDTSYRIIVQADLNGDGKLTAVDISKMQAHLVKLKILDEAFLKAADLNKDGSITAIDLARICSYAVGLNG